MSLGIRKRGLGSLSVRKRRRYLALDVEEAKEDYVVRDPCMIFLQQKCETEEQLLKAKTVSPYSRDKTHLLNLKRSEIQFEEKEWAPQMFGCDLVSLPQNVGFTKHAFLKKHALKSVGMHDLKLKQNNVLLQNNQDPGWDKGVVFVLDANVVQLVFDHGLGVFHKTETKSSTELHNELLKQEDLLPYFLGSTNGFLIQEESKKTFHIYRKIARNIAVYFHGHQYSITVCLSDTVQQLKEHLITVIGEKIDPNSELYLKSDSHSPYEGETYKSSFPCYQATEALNNEAHLAHINGFHFVLFSGRLCQVDLNFENEKKKITVQLPAFAQLRDVVEAVQGEELKLQFHESESLLLFTDYLWDIMTAKKSPCKLSFTVTALEGFWQEKNFVPFYMGHTIKAKEQVSLLITNVSKKITKTIQVQKNCTVEQLTEKSKRFFEAKSIVLQIQGKDLSLSQFVGNLNTLHVDLLVLETKHTHWDTHLPPNENTEECSLEYG